MEAVLFQFPNRGFVAQNGAKHYKCDKLLVQHITYCQQEQVMVYYLSGGLNYPHSFWEVS
jgi:hypothetical protein